MIIVLMGVTGAGKTTVGRMLAADLGWTFYDADDFHSSSNVEKMRRGEPLNDDDRMPWLEKLRDLVKILLEQGSSAVLACSALKSVYRDYLLIDDQVRLIYLRSDYSLIDHRLKERRNHYMNPSLLESQFEALEEPKQAITVDVATAPRDVVLSIREKIGI